MIVFSAAQLAYLGGGPNGGYARANVFNALQYNGDTRSLIESAYGGAGNDDIVGKRHGHINDVAIIRREAGERLRRQAESDGVGRGSAHPDTLVGLCGAKRQVVK